MIVLPFVVAAAAGALARANIGHRFNQPERFPFGTVVVNVAGSFLLGLLHHAGAGVATVAGVGALGAFTTFSAFARDSVFLAHHHHVRIALVYVALTLGLGLAAAGLGIALAPGG